MNLPILSALAGGVLLPAMVFGQYPIPPAPSYPNYIPNASAASRTAMPSPFGQARDGYGATPAIPPAPPALTGTAAPAYNGGAQFPVSTPAVRLGSPAMPQVGGYPLQAMPMQAMPQPGAYAPQSNGYAIPPNYNSNPGTTVQAWPVTQGAPQTLPNQNVAPRNYPVQGMPVQGAPVRGTTMQGIPNPGTPADTIPMQTYNGQPGEYVLPSPMQGMPMQGMPMQTYPAPLGSYPAPLGSSPAFVGEVLNRTGPEGYPAPAGTCGPNGACGPAGRFWVSGEYVYWIAKGASSPALVTSAPTGLPRNTAGTLGNPATTTVFGGDNLNNDWRSGFRVRSGFWFDCCQTIGLDASMFYLGEGSDGGQFAGQGNPGLFRPFRNALTGMQATELVAFLDPNGANAGLSPVLSGGVDVRSTSNLWGGDINLRKNLHCTPCSRLDLLLGYRYMRLRDTLDIREDLLSSGTTNPFAPQGTTIVVRDRFNTVNEFNGGQIGVAGEVRRGAFFLGYTAKVALGNVHSSVEINGSRTATLPNGGGTSTSTGGLLAQPSNIGRYSFDEFAVLPEGGLTLGYQVSSNVRAFAGYNFLYWNKVVRASEQVDIDVNPTQIPGGRGALSNVQAPAFSPNYSDYWVQGVTFGLELRF